MMGTVERVEIVVVIGERHEIAGARLAIEGAGLQDAGVPPAESEEDGVPRDVSDGSLRGRYAAQHESADGRDIEEGTDDAREDPAAAVHDVLAMRLDDERSHEAEVDRVGDDHGADKHPAPASPRKGRRGPCEQIRPAGGESGDKNHPAGPGSDPDELSEELGAGGLHPVIIAEHC